ncbi:Com family DNA-binding transcriptional regulator [Solimicrobium silvestre]|uniref:Mu-like prophage protein Com n=1 Tax=Solimicrobium silvestre TaxID=2099400 RepID=A0A2S9GTC2_9BURK|nr:Com family DNA-binding transcriptional regulator [Solimicrobium silvestre]PRC90972.1 Mu-like prophage protein Com [Solimicrobium silvestre]
MLDIRCGSCSRKLGEGEYITLSIKCPRCGTLNHLRATRSEPASPRASELKTLSHARKSHHSLAGRQTPSGG